MKKKPQAAGRGRPKNPGGAGVAVTTTLDPAVIEIIDELRGPQLATRSKQVAVLVNAALRQAGLLK